MSACGHEVYDEGMCGPCADTLRSDLAKAREEVDAALIEVGRLNQRALPSVEEGPRTEVWTCACGYMNNTWLCTMCGALAAPSPSADPEVNKPATDKET